MSELERIRSELWRVLDEVRDGDLDEDGAETQVSILDSLSNTFELEAKHQRIQQATRESNCL